jgi:hypothetical protein
MVKLRDEIMKRCTRLATGRLMIPLKAGNNLVHTDKYPVIFYKYDLI